MEASVEVKLPTIWTDGDKSPRRERKKEEVRRKKMEEREKVEKWRSAVFFKKSCGSGGSKR